MDKGRRRKLGKISASPRFTVRPLNLFGLSKQRRFISRDHETRPRQTLVFVVHDYVLEQLRHWHLVQAGRTRQCHISYKKNWRPHQIHDTADSTCKSRRQGRQTCGNLLVKRNALSSSVLGELLPEELFDARMKHSFDEACIPCHLPRRFPPGLSQLAFYTCWIADKVCRRVKVLPSFTSWHISRLVLSPNICVVPQSMYQLSRLYHVHLV